MKSLVVYFHGFGSSSKSSKAQALKDAGHVVYSFDIDHTAPKESIESLSEKISMAIADEPNLDVPLVFIGTSLGAWYAAQLSRIFCARAILINPSFSPETSLRKYGVSEDVLSKYESVKPNAGEFELWFAEDDPVIDNMEYKKIPGSKVVPNATHRFDESFNYVIDSI